MGTYNAVEFGVLVSDGAVVGSPGLAGAELPEVLRRLRNDVVEELHLDAAERLALHKSISTCP
jgi:hypothetical protein